MPVDQGAAAAAAPGPQAQNGMEVPIVNQNGGTDQEWADWWQHMFSVVMGANRRQFEDMVKDLNIGQMNRVADMRLGRMQQLRDDVSASWNRRTIEHEIWKKDIRRLMNDHEGIIDSKLKEGLSKMGDRLEVMDKDADYKTTAVVKTMLTEEKMKYATGEPEAWFQAQMLKTMCNSTWFQTKLKQMIRDVVVEEVRVIQREFNAVLEIQRKQAQEASRCEPKNGREDEVRNGFDYVKKFLGKLKGWIGVKEHQVEKPQQTTIQVV